MVINGVKNWNLEEIMLYLVKAVNKVNIRRQPGSDVCYILDAPFPYGPMSPCSLGAETFIFS